MTDPTLDQQGAQTPPEQDPPAADDRPKANRLSRRPGNTNGCYMVLAAPAGKTRQPFVEVGWYRAHSDEQARRQVIADVEHGHLDEVLVVGVAAADGGLQVESGTLPGALNEGGVFLRPVPARSWPKLEHPSGYQTTRKLVV